MGKSSSPATPDYTGAATATAAGNLQAAQQATVANRPNMSTPWGNSTWTNNQTLNQPAYDSAMQSYQQALQKYNIGQQGGATSAPIMNDGSDAGMNGYQSSPSSSGPAPIAPNQSQFMTGDNWVNNVSLSPSQQALFDQSNSLQTGLFGAQNAALDRVNQTMAQGFDTSGLPVQGSVLDPNALKYGDVLDANGLPVAGTALANADRYDPTQNTNNAADLIMARVNPQMAQQEESLRTRLANMGVTAGSEAWNNEMRNWNQQKNDSVSQAQLQGITLGMQQQGVKTTEQAQQYNQQTGLRQLAAALQQQRYGQQSNNNSQYMAAQNQGFGQQTTNRNNALALEQYQRALPMNELNALRTGNQVSAPQFQNYSQQATTGGADYLGATNQQYQAQLGASNAQNASNSSAMNGLFSLGSAGMGMYGMMNAAAPAAAAAGMFSDRRVKTNIVKIGKADNGLNIYSYNYVWGGPAMIGYMADEVEKVSPHAVGNFGGIKTVDYARV